MEEKIPPHDLDAEQSLLGSMMISKDATASVAGQLSEAHFNRSAHSHIFKAIIALFKKNQLVAILLPL